MLWLLIYFEVLHKALQLILSPKLLCQRYLAQPSIRSWKWHLFHKPNPETLCSPCCWEGVASCPCITSLDYSQFSWHNLHNCASQTSGRETKPKELRWFTKRSALSILNPNLPAPWHGLCMEIKDPCPFPSVATPKPVYCFTAPSQLCLASCHKNLPSGLRHIAEDSRDKGNVKLEVGQWGKTYLFHWPIYLRPGWNSSLKDDLINF